MDLLLLLLVEDGVALVAVLAKELKLTTRGEGRGREMAAVADEVGINAAD